MAALEAYCLSATPFTTSNEIDDHGFRQFLDRFVDARIGVYLGSGGNGESHALTADELRQVYEIGVRECGGKVPVHANLPETHTPGDAIAAAQLAIDAGVETLHMYTIEQRHGMRPTRDEYVAYFSRVLDAIRHPVVLCLNPTVGYMPPAETVAHLCATYHQIVGLRFTNASDAYIVSIKDAVARDVRYYAILANSPSALALGFDGIFGSKANIIPKTVRDYMDLCETGNYAAMSTAYMELIRFHQYVMQWHPAGARWIKMCMEVLRIPGWAGGVRAPYLMPDPSVMRTFADGLLALGIPEIKQLAADAGLESGS